MTGALILKDGEEVGKVSFDPYEYEYDGGNRLVQDILQQARIATGPDTAAPEDGGLAAETHDKLEGDDLRYRLEKEFTITDHKLAVREPDTEEKLAHDTIDTLRRLHAKGVDVTEDVVDFVTKAASSRRYIQDESEAPEGAKVQQGPEGGLYYEPGGGSPDDDAMNGEVASTLEDVTSFVDDPELAEAAAEDAMEEWSRRMDEEGDGADPQLIAEEVRDDAIAILEGDDPDEGTGVQGDADEAYPSGQHSFKTGDHPTEWERPSEGELDEYVSEMQDTEWWGEGLESFEAAFHGDDNTYEEHTDDDGAWSAERLEEVHDPAVEEMLNTEAESDEPIGVILMGPPGAGKGWWEENYADKFDREFTRVNSDDAKHHIPGYEGSNAAEVHEESSHIAKKRLAPEAIEQGHNIVFDNVASSSTHELKEAMEEAGHDMRAVFVDVPPEKSAHNVVSRYEDEGRFTPLDYTVGAREDSLNTFEEATDDMDPEKVAYYNNDVEWGEPPEAEEEGSALFKLLQKLAAKGRL